MTVAQHNTALAASASGTLIVDKPEGWTSHDVVAKVRRLLKTKKVGHTGTLDPMATGVLAVCVGDGTKVAGIAQAADKVYQVSMALGTRTDTLDRTGSMVDTVALSPDTDWDARVREALIDFTGTLQQIPPMYSAVKMGGEALYKKARRGETVERAARTVTIHAITDLLVAAPEVHFTVSCSKGTYIRTLVADLGDALGVGAHLTALRRTVSGPAHIADAISMDDLALMAQAQDFSTALHGEDYLLCDLPVLRVSETTARRMVQGIVPHVSELAVGQQNLQASPDGACPPETLCRVYGEQRGFFALLETGADPSRPARIRRIIKTRM